MKKLAILFTIVLGSLIMFSCDETDHPDPGFKDLVRESIYDYIAENEEDFSMFMEVLQAGNLDRTMQAYNPNGNDYTLFLPTNDAMKEFVDENNNYSTFQDLLNDKEYVAALARYHVINRGIITNDFPFGALPERNLLKQYITIGFEVGADTSFYKINNDAPLIEGNIEVNNGYIHIISRSLIPITLSTMDWLEANPNYSIFAQAVKETGHDVVLDRVIDYEEMSDIPVTLLVEADSVFNRFDVNNIDDLKQMISPERSDYTDPTNPLYNFVGYHILERNHFLADFENRRTNYASYGDIPLNINGDFDRNEENIFMNAQDTIRNKGIEYPIRYVTFYYDYSNVQTLSGSIHFIDNILQRRRRPIVDNVSFQFREESLINQYREEVNEYLISEQNLLQNIWWSGVQDILFIKQDSDLPSDQRESNAWDQDYLYIQGDFEISYRTPRIVPGTYTVRLRAHERSSTNALVEVFLDGVKIGGLVDLTVANTNWERPFANRTLGDITFTSYEQHVVTVRTLIPGDFMWDAIIFDRK